MFLRHIQISRFKEALKNFAKSIITIFQRNLNVSRNKLNIHQFSILHPFRKIYNMPIFYKSESFSSIKKWLKYTSDNCKCELCRSKFLWGAGRQGWLFGWGGATVKDVLSGVVGVIEESFQKHFEIGGE